MHNGRRYVCSLATGLLLMMSGACSTGSTGKEPTVQQAAALSATSAMSTPTNALLAEFDAQPPVTQTPPVPSDAGITASQAPSYAVSMAVPAWSLCNVYPQGVTNDPTRNANVQAGADGEVRFYPPPPQTWGTKLTVSCKLNGSSQGTFSIDLTDSSTFTERSAASLRPTAPTRVRPALTGDLSTIDNATLLQNGYPPRPDAATSPHLYSLWAAEVAKPIDVYQGIPVAHLNLKGTGSYQGDQLWTGTPGVSGGQWTGFVQAASGFESTGEAYTSTLYNK